ncbi:rhamnogalacturonase B [Xanthomonas translucens pv. undulosa]|uniref:rhamnogalacturonan lyase B N-terminal domain-containing protein n=1 Tax=Xanthomonas campestris pv. translucens TaxID=343 RepID=UPI0019D70BDF|nr:rhamnogalacturonan lyase B N-terminal domain-containing protein [Xanthomonas translucens]QSQ51786.1 rhamnogalacturonase B [Xanthomonas translucens pv. undulosa]QSQ59296.1 rhamnogalacturonase B [Xanthomonas translucens pv. undulosa]
MQRLLSLLLCCCVFCSALPAAAQSGNFGVTRSGKRIIVDSGAHLVFSVDTGNGDIVSMRYYGNELQSPDGKGSQIASGLGTAAVAARTIGDTIVVSAKAGDLTQYYMARKGRDALYMATYAPTLLPIGELRFVTRLDVGKLPNAERESDCNVGEAIESHDVFLLPDGRTSSKFYSARRAIDDAMHGVSGPGVAVYMLMGDRERSSGGPFFKDIATQKTAATHELYNYMFSNHTQTEPYRGGLHGVYALLFTDGGAPSAAATDLGFVDATLGLQDFLDESGRGAVSGRVSGVAAGQPARVGLSNGDAQYWAEAAANGTFRIDGVRPGRYRITLYQNELEVAQNTLKVYAGATAQAALQAAPQPDQVQWQIGVPDGTPSGFRNAALLASAHPSDTRMAPWGPLVYRVGSSAIGDFPAVQWRGVNTPTRIEFVLAANDVRDYRLRLYIPLAQADGRPQVRVNGRWNGPLPSVPVLPDTRGITRGTYRGNNTVYDIDIPATALQAGLNALQIDIASGSPDNGFLGPGLVFDSVQLLAM